MGNALVTSGSDALPEIQDSDDPTILAQMFRTDAGAVGELQIARDEGFVDTVGAVAEGHRQAVNAIRQNITSLLDAVEQSATKLDECGEEYENFRSWTIDSAQETYESNRQEALRELKALAEEIEAADLRGEDTSLLTANYETRKAALTEGLEQNAKDWVNEATTTQDGIGEKGLAVLTPFHEDFGEASTVAMSDAEDTSYRVDKDDLLVEMFGDNAGVLEVYAHMEDAIADTHDAINLLEGSVDPRTGLPTPDAMEKFTKEYADRLTEDPYFANVFAQEFGSDRMAEFAARVAEYDINVGEYISADQYANYTKALEGMGGSMMIATGSLPSKIMGDTRIDLFNEWNTYADKLTYDDQSLTDWRKSYQEEIIATGRREDVTFETGAPQYLTDSALQGYEALSQMWGAGAAANPDLVWSDGFLNGIDGEHAVGMDLLAWDNEIGRDRYITTYAGLPSPVGPRDPVQNLLMGMDMTDPPADPNGTTFDGVRKFLASDTSFDVAPWEDPDNGSKMNVTEYLVGYRFDPREGQFSDVPLITWEDGGEALGASIASAIHGKGAETPEGATIASGFIDGYSYGLEHNDLTASGWATDKESFGDTNSRLRTYSAAILGPYMGDIAGQMQSGYRVDGADPYIVLPNGEVVLALSDAQRDMLIDAESGIFSDLARDSLTAESEGRAPVLEGLIYQAGATMGTEMESAKLQLHYATLLEDAQLRGGEAGLAAEKARLEGMGVKVDSLPTSTQAQGVVDRLNAQHGEMYMHLESATGEALMHAGMEQDRANQVKADVAANVVSLAFGGAGKHIPNLPPGVWDATEVGKRISPNIGDSMFATDNLADATAKYDSGQNQAVSTINQIDTTINQRITLDDTPPAGMQYSTPQTAAEYSNSLPEQYQFMPPEGTTDPTYNYEATDQSAESLQREQQLNYYNSDPWLNGWNTMHSGNELQHDAEHNRDSVNP